MRRTIPLVVVSMLMACPKDSVRETPEAFSACSADEADPWSMEPPLGDEEAPVIFIEEDTLHVWVGYGGGCESHEVQICWDQSFTASDPVQAQLDLWHNANGDMCEAYLVEEYTFDLAPLRQAYIDAYAMDEGTISLQLDGHSVDYTFGP